MTTWQGVWREPDVETEDYPNIVVCDGRVTGSITIGRSRLPLWAISATAIGGGWDEVELGWSPTEHYGFTEDHFSDFVYHLLEQRGEFGRLLCVLADVERQDDERQDGWLDSKDDGSGIVEIPLDKRNNDMPPPWWAHEPSRKRVIDQLRACLGALEEGDCSWPI